MLLLFLDAAAARLARGPVLDNDTYHLVVLRKGPAWSATASPRAESAQAGHMANVRDLWDRGLLRAAGPVSGDGDIRGVFVLKASSLSRARALAASDPAVQAGRLAMDVYEWWGTRGIGEAYRAALAVTPNLPDRMRSYVLAFARRGPAWTAADTAEVRAAQQAHLDRLGTLMREGHIAAAGPLMEAGDYRGVWIFTTASPDEARRLLAEDPLIRNGQLEAELHVWYSPEGVLPTPRPHGEHAASPAA